MVSEPAAGQKAPGGHSDPPQTSRSTRDLPRRSTSPEKTMRMGDDGYVVQGPSKENYNSKGVTLPSSANRSRFSTQPGSSADSERSKAIRRPWSRRRKRYLRKNRIRPRGTNAEVDAQIDNDIRKAETITSTKKSNIDKFQKDPSSHAMDSKDDSGIDLSVCTEMTHLMRRVQAFAQQMPTSLDVESLEMKRNYLNRILDSYENAQLVRYIGYIATGGPKGEDGWVELLFDDTSRRALVIGIICHALKEKVFGALWFGASAEQELMLQHLESESLHQDGFFRTKARATKIGHFAQPVVDMDLARAEMKLTLQLENLLQPLWKATGAPDTRTCPEIRQDVHRIVSSAAALSRVMRRAGDVIYHFAPTFKDEMFEPRRMDCLNLGDMIWQSPYDKVTFDGVQRAILQEGQEAKRDALVRIVCCPGIEAYRQGGGTLAKAEIAEEKRKQRGAPPDMQRYWWVSEQGADALTGEEGFRSKIICKSVVLLQWGRQRLLTKAAGTSAHIKAMQEEQTAKYEADREGFVEFYDLGLKRWTSGNAGPCR